MFYIKKDMRTKHLFVSFIVARTKMKCDKLNYPFVSLVVSPTVETITNFSAVIGLNCGKMDQRLIIKLLCFVFIGQTRAWECFYSLYLLVIVVFFYGGAQVNCVLFTVSIIILYFKLTQKRPIFLRLFVYDGRWELSWRARCFFTGRSWRKKEK